MSVDTTGKIKGFVSHEELLNYIKTNFDTNASSTVKEHSHKPLSNITWPFTMNEHSKDPENEYYVYGYIFFNHFGEDRQLFYHYCNVNHLENLDYYTELGLRDMVEAETTFVGLGFWGSSVQIISDIVTWFGGGWVDENDCDNVPYQSVEAI